MARCSFRVSPVNKNHALDGLYSRLALLARPPSVGHRVFIGNREIYSRYVYSSFPSPSPEDKQDVQRSTEWAITQSGAQGGKVGGRENSDFLFGSRIPMMRRAVSGLMCGAWQCVVLCAVIGCNRVIWSVPQWADRYARSRLRGRWGKGKGAGRERHCSVEGTTDGWSFIAKSV